MLAVMNFTIGFATVLGCLFLFSAKIRVKSDLPMQACGKRRFSKPFVKVTGCIFVKKGKGDHTSQ